MNHLLKFLFFFIVFIGFSFSTSAQCAMCRAVVESGGKEQAEAINSGITYLMIIPYLLVGIIIFFL